MSAALRFLERHAIRPGLTNSRAEFGQAGDVGEGRWALPFPGLPLAHCCKFTEWIPDSLAIALLGSLPG
jgi:hypothetical protein